MLGSRTCKDVASKLLALSAKGLLIGGTNGAYVKGGGANKPQKKVWQQLELQRLYNKIDTVVR
jgi:hypothetical protein